VDIELMEKEDPDELLEAIGRTSELNMTQKFINLVHG
jgi:hypothetical protein